VQQQSFMPMVYPPIPPQPPMGYKQAHHMPAAPAMPTALPTRPPKQPRLHTPPEGAKAPILSSSPLNGKSHTRSDVWGFLTWLVEQQSEEDALEYVKVMGGRTLADTAEAAVSM
ncbi:hypothetical protein EJ04DRAFT_530106, partial [Polyplosphaeria fusca]